MIASDVLKNLDIPKTNARVHILETLISANKPINIVDLKNKLPEYNESTIYRNLEKFTELNIVKKINLNSDFTHFEFTSLASSHHSNHHHIVCSNCKTVECLDIYGVESLILPKIQKLGFSNIDYNLDFSGLCKQCS